MDILNEDFHNIRDLIHDRSGIYLADTKKNFLRIRLNHRLKVTGMESAKDYYFFLKYDPGGAREIESLIDAVTINETYFYREEIQLNDFVKQVLPKIHDNVNPHLTKTIWSAGCSTGEEPYTLAMLLNEYQGLKNRNNVRIMAADICKTVLKSAREGRYDEHSLRYLPPGYLLRHFDQTEKGSFSIKDHIKNRVQFAHINLMDSFSTSRIRDIDAVFCRNVIIYFTDEDKRKCLEHLYCCLKKGGYLFLGHSESLGRISGLFDVVRLKQTICYQKPE